MESLKLSSKISPIQIFIVVERLPDISSHLQLYISKSFTKVLDVRF